MVSLLDIKPKRSRPVTIDGQSTDVRGLSATDIATLLDLFPDLRAAFMGREIKSPLMSFGPTVVATVVAYATIDDKDGETEDERKKRFALLVEHVKTFPLGDQAKIVAEIITLTFPDGLDPFLESLDKVGLKPVVSGRSGDTGKASDTKSPSPSPKSAES